MQVSVLPCIFKIHYETILAKMKILFNDTFHPNNSVEPQLNLNHCSVLYSGFQFRGGGRETSGQRP